VAEQTALPELAPRGALQRITVPSRAQIDAEVEPADRMGARFVAIGEDDYPPLLSRADNPPPLIAIKGRANLMSAPAFAVVGARNASVSGAKLAHKLALQLGSAGFLIVSGLARGIDAAAHRGSLETGTGAVIAGGLDQKNPTQKQKPEVTNNGRSKEADDRRSTPRPTQGN